MRRVAGRYRQVRQFVREWGWLPSFVLLMYMLIMVHTLVSSLNG